MLISFATIQQISRCNFPLFNKFAKFLSVNKFFELRTRKIKLSVNIIKQNYKAQSKRAPAGSSSWAEFIFIFSFFAPHSTWKDLKAWLQSSTLSGKLRVAGQLGYHRLAKCNGQANKIVKTLDYATCHLDSKQPI